MADKSFGIKELNLIGASGTPTITSPNNLNLNASNVAISTDVTVGRHLDVDGHAEFDNVKITGVTTFSGEGITKFDANGSLFFNDASLGANSTGMINFGDSNDLKIYHDGTNSQIYESGSGSLRITTSKLELRSAGSEEMGNFYTDGAVELYYNNSKKFETAGSGINVVGTTTTGQLSVSGVSTFLSAINVSSSYGTSGQVLTSQGSGSAPQWATPAGGKILQVVTATYQGKATVTPGAGNYTDYSDNLSLLITPSSTSSRILLITNVSLLNESGRFAQGIVLYKNGTIVDDARGVVSSSRMRFWASDWANSNAISTNLSANYVDSPSTTSQIRYTTGLGVSNGNAIGMNRTWDDTGTVSDSSGISILTALEIGP